MFFHSFLLGIRIYRQYTSSILFRIMITCNTHFPSITRGNQYLFPPLNEMKNLADFHFPPLSLHPTSHVYNQLNLSFRLPSDCLKKTGSSKLYLIISTPFTPVLCSSLFLVSHISLMDSFSDLLGNFQGCVCECKLYESLDD